jgi:hypothetical protein
MQSAKRTISPLLYFILIASLTNLVFLGLGMAVLAILSFDLSTFGLQILMFLLLWKGALVGFLSWFWHKRANNKDFLVKFIGIYLGRFFGIFIGGFLGGRIFNTLELSTLIGFIIGALAFYFAGRWIGSRVSTLIGQQLEKIFDLPETQKPENIADVRSISRFAYIGFIIYGTILPFLLVLIGLSINYFDVPIGYLTELLPLARIIVIVLSIFSICSPWLMKNRWLNKYQTKTSSPESMVYLLGLILSIVPVIYGFLLFVAMGASIFELCLYAVISSVAAIFWSANHGVFMRQNAG